MKQTAVEWLVEKLDQNFDYVANTIIEQAKEMEKEQIIESWDNGYANGYDLGKYDDQPNPDDAEQYYNETFKSENIVMFMTPENGEIESIILTDNPDCGVKGITFKSE